MNEKRFGLIAFSFLVIIHWRMRPPVIKKGANMDEENDRQSMHLLTLAILLLLLSALACSNMLFIDNASDCADVGGNWQGSTCYTPGEVVDGKTSGDSIEEETGDEQEDTGNSDSTAGREGAEDPIGEGMEQNDDVNAGGIIIPTGTYIGKMFLDFSVTACVFENLGNAVTVTVTDDGTVSGSMSNKFTLTCVEREGCVPIGETTYISTITGQITETSRTIEIHEIHSFLNLSACNPPDSYTEENTIVAEIQVSGDQMTCTIPGEDNRLYFEATIQ